MDLLKALNALLPTYVLFGSKGKRGASITVPRAQRPDATLNFSAVILTIAILTVASGRSARGAVIAVTTSKHSQFLTTIDAWLCHCLRSGRIAHSTIEVFLVTSVGAVTNTTMVLGTIGWSAVRHFFTKGSISDET